MGSLRIPGVTVLDHPPAAMAADRPDTAVVTATDADLASRLRAGDASALETAYDVHGPAVQAVARRVTADPAAAEELTQEVFLHLWEHPERFRSERGSLRSFLLMIAHRRSVDRVRADVARRTRETRFSADAVSTPTDDHAILRVESRHVRQAIESLPSDRRRCIELAYFAGLTFRQVAEHPGLPEGTVKTRIRSALQELRHAT